MAYTRNFNMKYIDMSSFTHHLRWPSPLSALSYVNGTHRFAYDFQLGIL